MTAGLNASNPLAMIKQATSAPLDNGKKSAFLLRSSTELDCELLTTFYDTPSAAGWPGLKAVEFVDMGNAERIALEQFPRK
jgi:hypothetical protein